MTARKGELRSQMDFGILNATFSDTQKNANLIPHLVEVIYACSKPERNTRIHICRMCIKKKSVAFLKDYSLEPGILEHFSFIRL